VGVYISLPSIWFDWFDQKIQERHCGLFRKQHISTNRIKSMSYSLAYDYPNSQALVNFDCQRWLQKSERPLSSEKYFKFSEISSSKFGHAPNSSNFLPQLKFKQLLITLTSHNPKTFFHTDDSRNCFFTFEQRLTWPTIYSRLDKDSPLRQNLIKRFLNLKAKHNNKPDLTKQGSPSCSYSSI
jgi:hypothetical protein